MRLKQLVFMAVGFTCVGLGSVGVVVPILPTVPFLLLAAFCFAKSSQKLNDWFMGTRLYQNHLAAYLNGRGMTRQAKLRAMVKISALMALGLLVLLWQQVWVGFIITGIVWVCLTIYFLFGMKTIPPQKTEEE